MKRDKIYIAVLFLLSLLYFGRFLTGKYMIHGSDYLLEGYVFHNWIAEEMRKGVVPHWCPYIFGGLPLGSHLTFIRVIYLIFPVHIAWNWLFMLSMFFAGLGVFLLLKQMKVSSEVSFLSALIYMSSGCVLSVTYPGHDGKAYAAAFLPFIFLFLYRGIKKVNLWDFLIFGGLYGLSAVHSHFQIIYFFAYFCLSYYIYAFILSRQKKKLLLYGVLGALLAVFLAAHKFLPTFRHLKWGARGAFERGYEFATSWAIPVNELLNLITPHFSGILDNYWGYNYFRLNTFYLGILAILLFFLSFKFYKKTKFFLIAAIVTLLLSLGGNTPLYKLVYYGLPGAKKLRAPSMFFYITNLNLAIISGLVMQEILNIKNEKEKRRTLNLIFVFTGIISLLLLIFGAFKHVMLPALKDYFTTRLISMWGATGDAKIARFIANYPNFVKGLTFAFIITVIYTFIMWLILQKKLDYKFLIYTLCFVTLVDEWLICKKFLQKAPHPSEYFRKDEVVQFLSYDKSIFRVFPLHYEHARDEYLMYHGIQSLGGYTANPYYRYQLLIGAGKSVMFNPVNLIQYPHLLNILNTKYIIAYSMPETTKVDKRYRKQVAMWKNYLKNFKEAYRLRTRPFVIYLNEKRFERAFLCPDYVVVPEDSALKLMLNPDFNLKRYVILEEDVDFEHNDRVEGEVQILKYSANEVKIRVKANKECFLVLTDNYHPIWECEVDGVPAKIYLADFAFRAVRVPAGEHTVKFRCKSPDKPLHRLMFILGLIAFAFAVYKKRKEK